MMSAAESASILQVVEYINTNMLAYRRTEYLQSTDYVRMAGRTNSPTTVVCARTYIKANLYLPMLVL
jgi:hypothetical protein